jgi:hypothetical protein
MQSKYATSEKKKGDNRFKKKKNQHRLNKNALIDANDKRNKNCDVFVCEGNRKNKTDIALIKDIETIFFDSNAVSDKLTKRIGIDSHNAYAMVVKGYEEKKIVIKRPRKTDGTVDSIKYEYIVGCHIRKTVCKVLPNFLKIYGYLHKKPNEFLVIQRICPGTTLRELVCLPDSPANYKSMFDPKLKSIVLQVLSAIQVAQNMIQFTHYDLHFGNILIKHDNNTQKIKYNYKDRFDQEHRITVPVFGETAVVIDFGRSRTDISSLALYKNRNLFSPYEFLLKKKYNSIDIRKFNRSYDAKRFCTILAKYVDDFHIDISEIFEPHDAISYILQNYCGWKR